MNNFILENIDKLKGIFKIVGGMFISYLLVVLVVPILFLNNSPDVNIETIARLGESPSKMRVFFASLFAFSDSSQLDRQIEDFKQKTGAVEEPIPETEQTRADYSDAYTKNPVPGAVYEYKAKGVAMTEDKKNNQTVLRIDPGTNVIHKRFTLPDGRTINVMIPE